MLVSGSQGLALAQGYTTADSSLKQGMAVSVSPDSTENKPTVQAVNYENADKVIGIAVSLDEDLLAEVPLGSQVYVSRSGQVKAYVSDLNGAVKKGDLLTVSTLHGILMHSKDLSVTTVGTAVEDFDTNSAEVVQANDGEGAPITVKVSLLTINVDIKPPSPAAVAENSNNLLDKLSLSLTGHKINGLRVLTALAIFSTLLVIEGEIIYGTVTSSITALGRNPLAGTLIGRQSLRGIGIGLLILMIGTAAIGVLLWL